MDNSELSDFNDSHMQPPFPMDQSTPAKGYGSMPHESQLSEIEMYNKQLLRSNMAYMNENEGLKQELISMRQELDETKEELSETQAEQAQFKQGTNTKEGEDVLVSFENF